MQGQGRALGPSQAKNWRQAGAKTKATKTKAEPAQVGAFRLSADLLKRIYGHLGRLEATTPGLTFTRTDAVKVVLLQALDAADDLPSGGWEKQKGHMKRAQALEKGKAP